MAEHENVLGKDKENKGFLYFVLMQGTLEEASRYVVDWGLTRRFTFEQLGIFMAYFASYRVVGAKAIADLLDYTKTAEADLARVAPLARHLMRFADHASSTSRDVSADLRKNGDSRSVVYTEHLRDEFERCLEPKAESFEDYLKTVISPRKLERMANMLGIIVSSASGKTEMNERAIAYIERELPRGSENLI